MKKLLFQFCVLILLPALPAFAREKKIESWEELVKSGIEYRDRGRPKGAREYFETALKILDKKGVEDLRKALVLHDIAETYRTENKLTEARLWDMKSNAIYRKEIKSRQLGYEYSKKEPLKLDGGSLRPACYICHENWKVVPIFYGPHSGYKNEEVPAESDWKFTHKPGGNEYGDQRWYCRDCRQSF